MRIREQDYIVNQDFDVANLNYDKAHAHVEGIKELEVILKACIFIFDYHRHNYFYIKSYNEYFSEIPKQIKRPYVLFNSELHPEDVEFVKQIHHRAFQYIFSVDANKRKDVQLFYRCRMKTNTGKYEMTSIKTKLLETDSKGNIWLVMFLIQKAPAPSYMIPFIEISESKEIKKYNFNNSYNLFSDKEKKLINFIFDDKTNIEIAEIMNISVNTVKTHIKRMYNKLDVTEREEFQKSLLYIKTEVEN